MHQDKKNAGEAAVDQSGTPIRKSKPSGRLKYRAFIEFLRDEEVYTPATILQFGLAGGLTIPGVGDLKLKKQRVRIALGRLSRYHKFPFPGDGLIIMKGQGTRVGWYGWRWKQTLA